MTDTIDNNELVYRCVFYGRNTYKIESNSIQISSEAFSDRGQKPSVDRANLRENNPCLTQKSYKDAVVSLVVKDIRKIDKVCLYDGNKVIQKHHLDVIYNPIPDNISHSQIEPNPQYLSKSTFRKVLKSLSLLAQKRVDECGWEIKPFEIRED